MTPRWAFVPLLFLLFSLAPAWTQQPASSARGVAQIAIMSNLADSSPGDEVIISVKGGEDQTLLMHLSKELAKKFGDTPKFYCYKRGTPPFSDGQLGLSFKLSIVTHNDTLPISAFLEVFAPYARQVRMLFVIQGPFTYRGIEQLDNNDISFTVKTLSQPAASSTSLAVYDVDAVVKNPNISSVAYANSTAAQYGRYRRRVPIWILFALAVVIGVSGGLLINALLKQWKAEDATHAAGTRNGGKHER